MRRLQYGYDVGKTKRIGEQQVSEVYDSNNNCLVCDQYIYDQHKSNCKHYVKETYLEFIKRIQGVANV